MRRIAKCFFIAHLGIAAFMAALFAANLWLFCVTSRPLDAGGAVLLAWSAFGIALPVFFAGAIWGEMKAE